MKGPLTLSEEKSQGEAAFMCHYLHTRSEDEMRGMTISGTLRKTKLILLKAKPPATSSPVCTLQALILTSEKMMANYLHQSQSCSK